MKFTVKWIELEIKSIVRYSVPPKCQIQYIFTFMYILAVGECFCVLADSIFSDLVVVQIRMSQYFVKHYSPLPLIV